VYVYQLVSVALLSTSWYAARMAGSLVSARNDMDNDDNGDPTVFSRSLASTNSDRRASLTHTRATQEQQTTTMKTKNEEDEAPERIERSSDGRLPIGLKQ